MPAKFTFPRSCPWPSNATALNATLCDAQPPPSSPSPFTRELLHAPCNVLVTHHKSGTHLLRSLRNEVVATISPGARAYHAGDCDDQRPPDARRIQLWCGYCGANVRCDGANLTARIERARAAGCRVVHVVRAPTRMLASQQLYETRLAAAGKYDTLSHRRA
jgi:hypothetical protein